MNSKENIIEFYVMGTPIAKARPRASIIGGHAHLYTPKKTLTFESQVRQAFIEASNSDSDTFNKPCWVRIDLYLPLTKGDYYPINSKHPFAELKQSGKDKCSGKTKHTQKPDIDNYIKSILDGLNGVAFRDDSQVYAVLAIKHYGERPQTRVRLTFSNE